MPKLNPDLQIKPNRVIASDIMAEYGLQLNTFSIAKQGIENTTVIVNTENEKYALRVYRQNKKKAAHIQQELDFMKLLNKHELPVPHVFQNLRGSNITKFKFNSMIWSCILMEYMDGDNPKAYSNELPSDMAMTQAIMHKLGKQFAETQPSTKGLSALKGDEFIKNIDLGKIKQRAILDFLNRVNNFKLKLDPALPRGFNHLDYDGHGNILAKGNKLSAILDFDDLMYSPIVVCLAYTLWDVLATTKDIKKVQLYITEYEKTRKLNRVERMNLGNIILFRNYVIGAQAILFSGENTKQMNTIFTIDNILKQVQFI